ncbi:MAG: DUF1566 domain-containing protein [Treponema sp.]|jgi:hypothetical protein|nr:DUF1566 domain-containing protein [Treponema sp.]
MKKAFMVLLTVALCGTLFAGGGKDGGEAEISARAAIGRLENIGPLFEGDGGKDIRLAVLEPKGQGLSEDKAYLPVYVQGLLNNNFSKYSAITLFDRQNLNRILSEQDIALNGRFSDEDFVSISKLINVQYLLVGTLQKMQGNQYSVQLAVTDFKTGVRRATFMKNGTESQLEDGSLLNEASEELLDQLDVRLTAAGKAALSQGRADATRAEVAFAKGVAAEQSGAPVEALLNYTQSLSFDPSKLEALARLNTVSQEIRGGTISANILNDLEKRRSWLATMKTATAFFNEHLPFELVFDPNLMQEGKTDYAREQVNLAMRIAIEPLEAGFTALNTLIAGLEKTGKREDWGFTGWPLRNIEPKTPETVLFKGKRAFTFKVKVALVNERGKIIAESGVTLTSEGLDFSIGDTAVVKPSSDIALVHFPKVNANNLTPTLNVVIREVNGIKGKALNQSGYVAIGARELEEAYKAYTYTYEIGDIGPAGGIVFYDKGVKSDGWRYLEAAPAKMEFGAEWGVYGYDVAGTDVVVGTGKRNTQVIVERLRQSGESGTAARQCASLDIGGYKDWFLPSKDELDLMYQNLKRKGLGGFYGDYYWSSSQYSTYNSWYQYFNGGSQGYYHKDTTHRVRAVRAF